MNIFDQTRFIERIQVKEYTLDDLVGTCGGYIGMFLGYALVQFPQFLRYVFRTVKQQILVRQGTKKVTNEIENDEVEDP